MTVEVVRELRPALFTPASEDLEAPIVRYAREVLRFELWPRQVEILAAAYRAVARITVLRLGRRSGKGRMASVIALYEATANAPQHAAAVLGDEPITIACLANSAEQAKVTLRYIRELIRRAGAALGVKVITDNRDEVELEVPQPGGAPIRVSLLVLPTFGRSIRGRAIAVAILDEFAHAVDGDGRILSPQAASEILEAIVPATAQFPAGKVIVTSTPRWATGEFHHLSEQANSGLHPDVVEFHAATAEVNPLIPAAYLAREQARDPASYRREWLAEFDSGIGALFDEATVMSCVRDGEVWLQAVPGWSYAIAMDPAYTRDAFALLVGHLLADGRLVIDLARTWRGSRGRPVEHHRVLDEVAAISAAYNGAAVVTDQYAGQPISADLRARGVTTFAVAWTNETKLEAAQELRQRLYSGTIELPRDPRLIAELLSLEQRPTPSGKPRIAAALGSSDDLATALMALATLRPIVDVVEELPYGLITGERRREVGPEGEVRISPV